ncbi:DoxX family protein [uncultured Imperialibacter sp.]|uniref:DoxX family protein n=1 Tax=uncultured Imperialibacter sp. TaxID=1672639 RepID=UPI0030DAB457|tara:strand:+ start:435 stop:815 length:381 start_codon:yes stop_codon:yes gene_type:complete
MKRINILYWVFTGLFGGFMMFSAIPDIISVPDAVEMVSGQLGYPEYIIPFLGVAKALGVIALFIPGFPRVKEWAYAGLTFDLIGATYSGIAVGGFDPAMLMMVVIFGVEALSYIYYHKRLKLGEAS